MKISAVLLIALMISLPLIRAQEEGAITEEVIPEDIAEVLTGVGGGPAIAFIMDICDTGVAGVFDVIDTIFAMALGFIYTLLALLFDFIDTFVALCFSVWAKTLGALLNPVVACCTFIFTCFGACPWDTWVMWCWQCMDCIPIVACLPHTCSLAKSCAQLCGI